MRTAVVAAVAALSISAGTALAQMNHGHGGHGANMATPATPNDAAPSQGTVRRVDASARKLTIAHGPLENLGMPPMTMVFEVVESVSIDGISAGDKIRFVADESNGVFTVIRLEAAN